MKIKFAIILIIFLLLILIKSFIKDLSISMWSVGWGVDHPPIMLEVLGNYGENLICERYVDNLFSARGWFVINSSISYDEMLEMDGFSCDTEITANNGKLKFTQIDEVCIFTANIATWLVDSKFCILDTGYSDYYLFYFGDDGYVLVEYYIP